MSRFQFRLATFLRLREAVRNDRRKELAEAYQADDVLQQHSDRLQREMAELQERCRQASAPGPVNVDQILESQRYELTVRVQLQQLQKQREIVAAEIERRRLVLVEANRSVRVLEKLEERQAERHLQEESRREIKRLDEVAQQRSGREEVR